MSDESDDKTEAPTPHRLEKAREEGQIPRSRELTSLLILLVGVSVIWFGGVSLARRLSGMLSAGSTNIRSSRFMTSGFAVRPVKRAKATFAA